MGILIGAVTAKMYLVEIDDELAVDADNNKNNPEGKGKETDYFDDYTCVGTS